MVLLDQWYQPTPRDLAGMGAQALAIRVRDSSMIDDVEVEYTVPLDRVLVCSRVVRSISLGSGASLSFSDLYFKSGAELSLYIGEQHTAAFAAKVDAVYPLLVGPGDRIVHRAFLSAVGTTNTSRRVDVFGWLVPRGNFARY